MGRAFFVIIIIVPFCLGLYCDTAWAIKYMVGGTTGWNNNTRWPANGMTFNAEDILVFIYDPSEYNVASVDITQFETCKAEGASVTSSGNDEIHLVTGQNRFITTKGQYCENNIMKLEIYAN